MTTVFDLANMGVGVIQKERNKVDRQIAALHKRIASLVEKRSGLDADIREAKQAIDLAHTPPRHEINWFEIDALLRGGKKLDAIKLFRDSANIGLMDSKAIIEGRMAREGIVLVAS